MQRKLLLFPFLFLAACAAVEQKPPAAPPTPLTPPSAAVNAAILEPPAGGTVTLAPAFAGLEHEGLWRQNFCLADINGDGNVDWIAPPPRAESAKPYIFLGDGRGGWREWTEAKFPALAYGYGGVDAADIDGNGLVDLVMGCHERPMQALFQVEPGVFESRTEGIPSVAEFTSRMVKLVDFTGDGRPELVALNESALYADQKQLNLLRQVVLAYRDGRWSRVPIYPGDPPPQAFGDSLATGDFDGDGRTDFATACHLFNDKQVLFFNRENGIYAQELTALPDLAYLFHVGTGDFDRDGRMDLVYTGLKFDKSDAARQSKDKSITATLFIAYNRPDGWVISELIRRNEGRTKRQFRGLAIADFDGNGYVDVATVFDDGSLYMLLNRDGKSFERASTPGWIVKGKASWMGTADFNKDGVPDLAVAYGSEKDGGALHAYQVGSK